VKRDSGTNYPCPACDNKNTGVVDSRMVKGAKRRRRSCKCGERFTTYEIEQTSLGDILEKNKLFDKVREKLSTLTTLAEWPK